VPPRSRLSPAVWFLSLAAAVWLPGCAASLGPGYLVERQEVSVSFRPQPEPVLRISAEYRLRNTGNQALDSLDVRLPGRRFRPASSEARWDDQRLALGPSPNNPRDTLLAFPAVWRVGEAHSLRFTFEIPSSPAEDDALGFAADAFYLPSEGWTPQLPQPRGLLGFGGAPPQKWDLLVRVPEGFLVHASGGREKHSGKGGEVEYRFSQTSGDLHPFVVAGRYRETGQALRQGLEVRIWTREIPDSGSLGEAGVSLAATLAGYDALFGARAASNRTLWIVECPSSTGCLPAAAGGYGSLLYGPGANRSAALVSRDAVVVDPRAAGGRLEASAGPAFAAGWLGYGQNPGYYEQQPPVSALPAFAAALAREASGGPAVGQEVIRRALDQIPAEAGGDSNQDPNVVRAKSLLLFYALRDRVGAEAFQKALQHMLFARQGRGFDVRDLISALEEESHQPVGPFVRRWIKAPGVPKDFRDRYSESSARRESLSQEAKQ
jgi:hypothetical protein